METIVLNSNKYVLVPENEWDEVKELLKFYLGGGRIQPIRSAEAVSTVLDYNPVPEIELGGEDIRKAQPKISEYRERFKKRQLRKSDIIARPSDPMRLYQFGDDEFNKFADDNGKSLFFGQGLEEDYV